MRRVGQLNFSPTLLLRTHFAIDASSSFTADLTIYASQRRTRAAEPLYGRTASACSPLFDGCTFMQCREPPPLVL